MLQYAYDIGAGSIGWVIYDMPSPKAGKNQTPKILGMGVRIFSDSRDPKDEKSLASKRRLPRAQRRRRDRYKKRRHLLMNTLIRHGLMPDDQNARKALETLDPFLLRAKALEGPLPPHHIGRAVFHLNQRRGFQSNRKTDKTAQKKDEAGIIERGASELEKAIKEGKYPTLGVYLNSCLRDETGKRHKRKKGKYTQLVGGVRARLRGQGAKKDYDIYPLRAMIEAEFDKIWAAQEQYHPEIFHETARTEIRGILLFQRPLKPVEVGRCTFFPEEPRAAKALPLVQRGRIYQEVNHLQFSFDRGITWRKITLKERDLVVGALLKTGKQSWSSIRNRLGFSPEVAISLEKSQKKEMKGDETAAKLRSTKGFGKAWDSFSPATQRDIVHYLLNAEKDEVVIDQLQKEYAISHEQAQYIAQTNLPSGYGRLCETALTRLLPKLEGGSRLDRPGELRPLTYHEAIEEAFGRSHSAFDQSGNMPHLPYYGKILERYTAFGTGEPQDGEETCFGRIANPSVHVGLNELRKLVNTQIAVYGPPDRINIELLRELKLNGQQKRDLEIQQKKNREANERYRTILEEQGLAYNGGNRLRLRLWEELDPEDCKNRCCPYTGRRIAINTLFSPEIEIEHILPFSRTLDNSVSNRSLCFREVNRAKTNKTPFEAFGNSPNISGQKYDWKAILTRAGDMPNNKSWRFSEDAMERFDKNEDFLARHMTDSQYVSRLAREYLSAVCPPERIVSLPGRLTGLVRGRLGLNTILSDKDIKNRYDHRHHAIDAAVIGIITRGFLKEVSTESARQVVEDPDRFLRKFAPPWPSFHQDVQQAAHRFIVSHKPEHGKEGRLHEDTAYGLLSHPEEEHLPQASLVYRKPVENLTKPEVANVRDDELRKILQAEIYDLDGKNLQQALQEFSQRTGIRRVRILKVQANYVPIKDKKGQIYKAVLANEYHHMDIYADAKDQWRCEAISLFDANQTPAPTPGWAQSPENRLIMRVHKGDLLELAASEHAPTPRIIKRVIQLEPSNNRVLLAAHYEGGKLVARHKDETDRFRWDYGTISKLKKRQARLVKIDPIGRRHE